MDYLLNLQEGRKEELTDTTEQYIYWRKYTFNVKLTRITFLDAGIKMKSNQTDPEWGKCYFRLVGPQWMTENDKPFLIQLTGLHWFDRSVFGQHLCLYKNCNNEAEGHSFFFHRFWFDTSLMSHETPLVFIISHVVLSMWKSSVLLE